LLPSDSAAGALLATAAAFLGAWVGVHVRSTGRGTRVVVPFAGGLLLGICVFGLLPEAIAGIGWVGSLLLFPAGYLAVRFINRHLFPVCPSCTHDHDHAVCSAALHGFAAPLVTAAAVHSILDGWSIVTAGWITSPGLRLALPLAVVLHKIPEGIALGAILRAASSSRAAALAWCGLAEGVTLLGGAAGLKLAPLLGEAWLGYPLAVAGGFFFYLGFHAVHSEWKRRGALPAFMPALTGAAGAAVLQRGVEAFLR